MIYTKSFDGCSLSDPLELATEVSNSGSVPLICSSLNNINDVDLPLLRACAVTLGDIAKHSNDLGLAVCAGGAIDALGALANHPDEKLRRHVLTTLSMVGFRTVLQYFQK